MTHVCLVSADDDVHVLPVLMPHIVLLHCIRIHGLLR